MSKDNFKVQLATKEREFVKVYKDFLKSGLLTTEEKLVFIALKSFVGYGEDQGEVFPGMEILCKMTSLSRPRATRAINKLITKGIVKKQRRGLTKTNLYTLADNPAMWETDDIEKIKELSESIIPYTSKELIEELERRGDLPSRKKEPVSADQSKETDPTFSNCHCKPKVQKNQAVNERYTLDDVRALYNYDALIQQTPNKKESYDLIVNILYDALNTSKPTIRVKGEDKPAMVVISKLCKLNFEHIDYVLQKFEEISATTKIKDTRAYLLTMLYQAAEQLHFDINNLVNYDMAHWGEDK